MFKQALRRRGMCLSLAQVLGFSLTFTAGGAAAATTSMALRAANELISEDPATSSLPRQPTASCPSGLAELRHSAVPQGRLRPVAELKALGAPIVGAVVTSPYGWRIHPILRKRRFHKGVDFGAPFGTPVLAAQDGVVEEADWHGHYGYYLRIRHSDHLETAYAHLSRIKPALKPGVHVSKGQVVAAVGETGWATGPHLYYEVIVDGHRIDPLMRHRARQAIVVRQRIDTQEKTQSG